MHWLTMDWWKYLLEHPLTWEKFWCRMAGHPCGMVFYNCGGLEPDPRCKNCSDIIG